MNKKIIKPKIAPIKIEPWFFRYLNEGQLKVVAAILAYADIKDRTKNSFPSNRTIAFYCGFGDIKQDSNIYEKYQALTTEEERIKFKNKRIKTVSLNSLNYHNFRRYGNNYETSDFIYECSWMNIKIIKTEKTIKSGDNTLQLPVPKKYSEFREVLQVAFSIFLWPPHAILVSNT